MFPVAAAPYSPQGLQRLIYRRRRQAQRHRAMQQARRRFIGGRQQAKLLAR
jgi:hypothetical protein